MPFGRYWGIAVDAARAPHGDGNSVMKLFFLRTTPIQPAPLAGTATTIISSLEFDTRRCNPHPSRGRQRCTLAIFILNPKRDATRPPRGDGNPIKVMIRAHFVMQPAPSRGQQPDVPRSDPPANCVYDATRTPRGDGNPFAGGHDARVVRMQPAPLAGTATQSSS